MSNYIYILTDANRKCLHVGTTQDLQNAIKTYKELYGLFFDSNAPVSRLVYKEEFLSEESSLKRFEELKGFTRMQKERLIRRHNPNWVDLSVVRPINIFRGARSTEQIMRR